MQHYFEIPVGGEKIAACLTAPDAGRLSVAPPVVVCCHGLTGTRIGTCYRFVSLARRLVELNISCLRFDFRGCGESGGRFEDLTSDRLLDDLLAVINALDHAPLCDPTRVGIVGSSFGGYTASRAAGRIRALRCLAYWAPVARIQPLIDRDMEPEAMLRLSEQGWLDHVGLRLGRPFFERVPQDDGPSLVEAAKKPLLVFCGKEDEQVPVDHGKSYVAAAERAGVDARYESLDVKGHSMRTVAANERIIEGTADWMRRYLHPEPVASSTS